MGYHERLGLSAEAFEDLEEHFERRTHGGREYRHLPDYRSALERGTVLIGGEVVRGFPKVPRTLVLEAGVPEHFDGEIAVEEKLDGYNTRVVRLDGEILAFTRSGIVCPFTTHKARTLADLDPLFEARPNAMVCGEMVGPENPYTAHDYPGVESVAFRAFDLRDRESGEPLPVCERREVYDEHGVPQVPFHGVFDPDSAAPEVRGIIEELDAAGREGVVMKAAEGGRQLKYTTSAANQGDLAFAFSLPFDYGQSFMFRRIVREGFQAVEWGESPEEVRERAHDLGESILASMVETIREIDAGNRVGERHTVRAPPDVVEDLLAHLRGQGLQLEVEADRREGGERVVTFEKKTQATNDRTQAYLDGQVVTE